MEVTLTDANFQKEVLQSETPVLVDFWAPWCGPCRAMAPILEEVAKEYQGKYKIAKMNVDENQMTPGQFNVLSIPTMVIIKNGQVVDQIVGGVAKETLTDRLDKALS